MHFLWVLQFLWLIVGPLVGLVFRMIGFGFVTYVGFNVLISTAKDAIFAQMGNSAVIVQQILGLAKIDVCINIILAAVLTRFILAGIDKAQDRKRNQVWRAPGGGSMDA